MPSVDNGNADLFDGTKSSGNGRCAAIYVRMSTEHQQYSTQNQEDAIYVYAKTKGFKIVRTYSDDGKSGLDIIVIPNNFRNE